MDEKAVWGLAGAFLGWLLKTGTEFVTNKMRVWRLTIGLREELTDLAAEIENVLKTLKTNLNMVGASMMGPTGVLELQHVFYQQAYKEVFPALGQGVRLSFQRIHAAIDSLNEQMLELDTLYLERGKLGGPTAPTTPEIERLMERWQQQVKDSFINASSIRFYIGRHLEGLMINPVEHLGEDHRAWLKSLSEAESQADHCIQEGKDLRREDFFPTYDAERFSQAVLRARMTKA